MSAGPLLSVDLWDSQPPEARALILALRAEAAELRAKVQALEQQIQGLDLGPQFGRLRPKRQDEGSGFGR